MATAKKPAAKKAAAKKSRRQEGRGEEGTCEEGSREEGSGEEGRSEAPGSQEDGCQEGSGEEGRRQEGAGEEGGSEEGRGQEGRGQEGRCQEKARGQKGSEEARCEESSEKACCQKGCCQAGSQGGACCPGCACGADHAEPAGRLAVSRRPASPKAQSGLPLQARHRKVPGFLFAGRMAPLRRPAPRRFVGHRVRAVASCQHHVGRESAGSPVGRAPSLRTAQRRAGRAVRRRCAICRRCGAERHGATSAVARSRRGATLVPCHSRPCRERTSKLSVLHANRRRVLSYGGSYDFRPTS